jgi:hypothetical protein
MRRLGLLSVLLVIPFLVPEPSQTAQKAGNPAKKLGDLYLVAIGQEDGWKFLPESCERVFRDQGKAFYREMRARVLTGPNATRKQFLDGVAWMCKNAKADDLVVLYIACHGTCNAKGESVFFTRDGSVRPQEIKKELAQLPCHAIVINDACCSGNWPKEFPGDSMPPNVTALCCCLSTQTSGVEFDITLFEALYGRADFNKDGVVDLDEVIKYCGLRIKEVQGGKLTPVMVKAKNLKAAPILTKVNPDLVSVIHHNEVYSALVEKQDGHHSYVRVIGCNDKPGPFFVPTKYIRSKVLLPKDGPALMVRTQDGWQPACLVGTQGEECKVRHLGSNTGEEIVAKSRVRHLFAGNPGEAFPVGLFKQK